MNECKLNLIKTDPFPFSALLESIYIAKHQNGSHVLRQIRRAGTDGGRANSFSTLTSRKLIVFPKEDLLFSTALLNPLKFAACLFTGTPNQYSPQGAIPDDNMYEVRSENNRTLFLLFNFPLQNTLLSLQSKRAFFEMSYEWDTYKGFYLSKHPVQLATLFPFYYCIFKHVIP